MWTPRFPRVAGYQTPEGAKPVYAVQLTRALVGEDIRIDVSVLLGSAEPPAVPVATVLVSPGSRVVVEQLTRFGVQPLTLSMTDVAPMTPFVPTVISVSPDIEIADPCLMPSPISWRRRRWRCGPPRRPRSPISRACRTTTRRRPTRTPSSTGCGPCWRAARNGWRA
jgi:hypothetical protein